MNSSVDDTLAERIRKKVDEAARENSAEYASLLPKKDVCEPDPDTDKDYFSPERRHYETSLDKVNESTQTAIEFHDLRELDEILDSLNHTIRHLTHVDSAKGNYSFLKKWLRKIVRFALNTEIELTEKSLSEVTRAINEINHKSRIFAGKQESFNSEFAVFGQKIVPVVDEKIRLHVEKHSRYLKDRMDVFHQGIDRHQVEIANWLHNTASAFDNCLERVDRLDNELKRGLALQHRKLEQMAAPQIAADSNQTFAGTVDEPCSAKSEVSDYAYYLFENQGRGSESYIKDIQAEYVRFFRNASPVADVGCGRGEFLELLKDAGIPSVGVDSNSAMVQVCLEKNLKVSQDDCIRFLQNCEQESLGGIFAGQVVEHLSINQVYLFLQAAFKALRSGGVLVFETINTSSPFALLNHFFKDPTHHLPRHPDTYKFFTEIAGFENVSVTLKSPVSTQDRPVIPVMPEPLKNTGIEEVVKRIRDSLESVSDFLYAPCDIAVYGKKPEKSS